MMTTIRRVVVHAPEFLAGSVCKPVPFPRCLLDYLGLGESGRVDVELCDDNDEGTACGMVLKVTRSATATTIASGNKSGSSPTAPNSIAAWANGASGVLLTHPPFCPVFCIRPAEVAQLPSEVVCRGIDVGVVVLVESSDSKLLLTRRAAHMRTFPNTWVPPGGHIEPGETIVAAGMRELKEETGLDVGFRRSRSRQMSPLPEQPTAEPEPPVLPPWTSCSILGLWESVYPYELGLGLPQRHHVVIYLRCRSPLPADAIDAAIRLDPNEVGACAWLTPDVVASVAARDDAGGPPGGSRGHRVTLKLVDADGGHRHEVVENFEEFTRQRVGAGAGGGGGGRLSTGTQYAMRLLREERMAAAR